MKFIKWLFVSLLLVGWVAQFECNKMVTESEENGSDSVLMSRYVNLVSPAFGAIVHVATVPLVWNEIPNGEKIEVAGC